MYQVINLCGDFEPWWFLDDWKEDITELQEFSTFEEAEQHFLKQWQDLQKGFPYFESRSDYLAAFWDNKELRWCEECTEDLQQYHSILLLKDYQLISEDRYNDKLSISNAEPRQPSSCRLSL
ncbi:DUF1033 family protein [Streptococcus hillyeri]|uniref:DUF1033 family protein n=1 Tax=Streptococcus hillyeri TaxID=2282420 RepID=A0A3L9DSK3_9STRE|nr:DUF1033 family protein [Streptococcus hillyeri]RLY03955.1 DUF1033 family protein [Streptococcus hillyeri]